MDLMMMTDWDLLPVYVIGGIMIVFLGGYLGKKIADYLNKRDDATDDENEKFSPV